MIFKRFFYPKPKSDAVFDALNQLETELIMLEQIV